MRCGTNPTQIDCVFEKEDDADCKSQRSYTIHHRQTESRLHAGSRRNSNGFSRTSCLQRTNAILESGHKAMQSLHLHLQSAQFIIIYWHVSSVPANSSPNQAQI